MARYIVRCERIYSVVVLADSSEEAIQKATNSDNFVDDFEDIFELQDEEYSAELEGGAQ